MENTFRVTSGEHGQRLDRVLARLLPEFSRGAIQKLVNGGCCHLDGQLQTSCSVRVREGQTISCILPDTATELVPEDGAVDIVWQDEHLLVCNKVAGLTMHPCPSCTENTLVQRLLARFPSLGAMEGQRPGIVHRIDKDTSGLVIVALQEPVRLALSEAFARREVHKEYLALVAGVPPAQGESREPIGRDPVRKTRMAVVPPNHGGRDAHSEWRVLWTAPDESCALLGVRIHTGRTHQIRVHMAHAGHPLLGDAVYTPAGVRERAPRQMLHAWHLEFAHPVTGEQVRLACPPPADMRDAALRSCAVTQRVIVVGAPGCGKSALVAALAQRGLPVFSADACVAELYGPNGEAGRWLAGMVGPHVLDADGSVDKRALFDAMQRDTVLKRDVEAMVHGLVRERLAAFWQAQEQARQPVAVAEIPLYLECGWRERHAVLVGVSCPLETRFARLEATRGWSREKIATLEAWQWDVARKEKACDILVDNSADLATLEREATQLCDTLARRRQEELAAQARALDAIFNA